MNKTLTTLSLSDNNFGNNEKIVYEAISAHCTSNLAIQQRLNKLWAEATIMFSFVKANNRNSLQYSILPLLSDILSLADLQQNVKKNAASNQNKIELDNPALATAAATKVAKRDVPFASRFVDSRFFKALLSEALPKAQQLEFHTASAQANPTLTTLAFGPRLSETAHPQSREAKFQATVEARRKKK